MAGLNLRRRAAVLAAALALTALFLSGCMQPLGLLNVIDDRMARADFEYGVKTVSASASYAASLGVNGDTLYVLYFDSVARKLFLVKSPDKGKTWNAPYTVDNTTDWYNVSNNLAVDGTTLYLCYQRSDKVYFVQLTDTGSTFTASNFQTISTFAAYPFGYENSIACDASNVYIVFSEGGAVAFTYAAKAGSINFPDPVCVDSNNGIPPDEDGNRKRTSLFIDADGYVNVVFFDDFDNYLRHARFLPTDSLPYDVPELTYLPGPANVTSANYPSIGSIQGSLRLISYYDDATKTLNWLEKFSYGKPPLMMLFYTNVMRVVDDSSSDVGRFCKSLFVNNTAFIAYYDYANKQVKLARGVKIPWNPDPDTPPYYSFTTASVDTVGGANFDLSLGASADGQTLYILYYDSSGSGALKLAKSIDGGLSW